MDITNRHFYVHGMVQGINFRYMTREKAEELGLVGFVRNTSDGRVEIHVQGQQQAVNELVQWVSTSPGHSAVSEIEEATGEHGSGTFNDFSILY